MGTSPQQQRQNLRLEGYDYSKKGAYFITIVACHRECLFGDVFNGKMQRSIYGNIAYAEWFQSLKIREEIELFKDEFALMPNHVHGIIWISPKVKILDLNSNENLYLTSKYSRVSVGATGRSPLRDQYELGSDPFDTFIWMRNDSRLSLITSKGPNLSERAHSCRPLRDYYEKGVSI
jgi:REP element-mobilizing transposase RayT